MNTQGRRGLRVLARLVAFVVAIPAMSVGATLALQALYGLAKGTPSVVGRGAILQGLSALAFLALLICGVRLLVFATNARAANDRGRQERSGDDTAELPQGPLAGRARFARVESQVGLTVSGLGLGLLLLSLGMRWSVEPIVGILLVLHGGLTSIAGKALARPGSRAWLAQALPIGFFAFWRLTYCAEALLDRCS